MSSRALRERLARVGPLSDAYHLARELWWMAWDTPAHARARVEREFAARPDTVWDILRAGSARARETARVTMDDVRGAMKIAYPIR